MSRERSSLANWTPEEVALGRRWVQAWREAGPEMERLRRAELRSLDAERAIALLCGPADYRVAPGRRGPLLGWWNSSNGSRRLPVVIEGIIVRQTGKLDWDYIRSQLQPLVELKEDPKITEELERRKVEFEQ